MRVDRFLRIGVGRTGLWKLAYQLSVTDGGKQHARQGQQIGGRNMAIADARNNTKGVKYRHRCEIGQPHHHHLPQLEGFTQLCFARLGREIHRRISRHSFPPRHGPRSAFETWVQQTWVVSGWKAKRKASMLHGTDAVRTYCGSHGCSRGAGF